MDEQPQVNLIRLFFSILTACLTGVAIAFAGLMIGKFTINKIFDTDNNLASAEKIGDNKIDKNIKTSTQITSKEILEPDDSDINNDEEDKDTTFVTSFSRAFIYSADNGREIIESAKNSLPHLAKSKVSADSYVVIDFDRNAIILEKDSDKILPIASITKLVTAVIAKKYMNKNSYITISKNVLNAYGNEAKLREGEKLRVNELLYPLLMVSSNDSAEALANGYVLGRKEFISKMNEWVNNIGAYRTYFYDPSGLSARNISTAHDLSIISKWILDNEPDLFDITLLKSKTIRTHTWTNPTHFLNLTSYAGGKNGYTPEADRTSVAIFKLGLKKEKYGVILLGSEARDGDVLNLLQDALK